MKIYRIVLSCLILGIAAPGLLAPRTALAVTASTIQVNCAGKNADNSGCTWKLSASISYEWTNGAHYDRGFKDLVPVLDADWQNFDLHLDINADSNVKAGAPDISGRWQLDFYQWEWNSVEYVPDTYTLSSDEILDGAHDYPFISVFAEQGEMQNAYLYAYSGQAGQTQYDTLTMGAI